MRKNFRLWLALGLVLALIIPVFAWTVAATFDSDIVPAPGTSIRLGVQPDDISSISNTIFFNGQNMGIGASPFAPTERLVIDGGGLKFSSMPARPGCDAGHRGLIWVSLPSGFSTDSIAACLRDDSGGYVWIVF